MAYLLTLAKSFKVGGRCIAGKLIDFNSDKSSINKINQWIRPIPDGTNPTASVPNNFCTLQNGDPLKNLDIIEINLIQTSNAQGQPENHFFDSSKVWRKVGKLNAETVFQLVENPHNLWLDPNCSSDRCTQSFINKGVQQSLYLIQVTDLRITLSKELNEYDNEVKFKTLASFNFGNHKYDNLSITCPAIRKIHKNQYPEPGKPPKVLPLRNGDDYVLCISLGPLFNNYHYKFVAAIFDRTGYLQETFNS
ncbi:dual OB domain-containing protein [Acinetobacter junii]|uniref:dual OB domain-containing protein n=1 Tax=Acinetobacter junii TaxID=40215 RepID=UPI003FA2B50C